MTTKIEFFRQRASAFTKRNNRLPVSIEIQPILFYKGIFHLKPINDIAVIMRSFQFKYNQKRFFYVFSLLRRSCYKVLNFFFATLKIKCRVAAQIITQLIIFCVVWLSSIVNLQTKVGKNCF